MTDKKRVVGVIINPLAGLGGRVGLKGSDGQGTVEKALSLGARPEAAARTALALSHLLPLKNSLDIWTYTGDMGETVLRELGFAPKIAGSPQAEPSSAQDTREAAEALERAGVQLILFAGGDGTARDIYEAIGARVPVIGIPAGVKMHSAVYAVSPGSAGLAAREFLEGGRAVLKEAEVMDIDEELFRAGQVSARLYGYMMIPQSGGRMQRKKTGGGTDAGDLAGLAACVAGAMKDDVLYIVGPGSTTRAIMAELGLPCSLLGVDAVRGGRLVARDATESELWQLVKDPCQKVVILITIIGGQGSLLGRGNQQISPRIIRRVQRENIMVVATAAKLLALGNAPLTVDTGDGELDEALGGYIKVIISCAQSTYYAVGS